MSFSIRPGYREKLGLILAVSGASGSGKTFTALLLATGIAGPDGKIVVVDSESGRALHYAPLEGQEADPTKGTFAFDYIPLEPPFTPAKYDSVITFAEKNGANVVVIDSFSHEWDGEGGCIDMADRNGLKGLNKWAEPKRQHKRLIYNLVRRRIHVIMCLRAYEKSKQITLENGKKEIVNIGFIPVAEKNFIYEVTASLTLHPSTPGIMRYDLPFKMNNHFQSLFKDGVLVGIEQGKALRDWADTGQEKQPENPMHTFYRETLRDIEDAPSREELERITSLPKVKNGRNRLAEVKPDWAENINKAVMDAVALFDTREAQDGNAADNEPEDEFSPRNMGGF